MKLASLIERVKKEKPHSFSQEDITKFINEIEAEVQEVLGVKERFSYDWENDGGKELLVTAPYDTLYENFIKAKIDFSNEEYESYANHEAQFSEDFDRWKAYVIRSGQVKEKALQIKNWW